MFVWSYKYGRVEKAFYIRKGKKGRQWCVMCMQKPSQDITGPDLWSSGSPLLSPSGTCLETTRMTLWLGPAPTFQSSALSLVQVQRCFALIGWILIPSHAIKNHWKARNAFSALSFHTRKCFIICPGGSLWEQGAIPWIKSRHWVAKTDQLCYHGTLL